MRVIRWIVIVSMALGAAACVTPPLHNMPLEWRPTSPPDIGTLDLSRLVNTRLLVQPFADARPNRQLIAENREDPTPKTVTTQQDVGAFVAKHVREVLANAGIPTVMQGGNVILTGVVRQFFVEETSTYKGRVLLAMTLQDRAGAVLWRGEASGTAEHFGRSYRAENYYETLSDATLNAAAALVQNPQFRKALDQASAS